MKTVASCQKKQVSKFQGFKVEQLFFETLKL